LLAVVGAIVAVLATPGLASAQGATEDSVTGSGQWTTLLFNFNVRSGPSGENPTGQVTLSNTDGSPFLTGPVTCLAVRGNVATINFTERVFSPTGLVTLQVTDRSASGLADLLDGGFPARSPGDCSPFSGGLIEPVIFSGDIVVVDAQPFPISKDQCKNGGWHAYGVFKNQGDCVSFVATGGKNPPAGH
jgi:hypothetical protein